jgi:hypothetical protein
MKFSNPENKYNTFKTGQRNHLLQEQVYRPILLFTALPLLYRNRGLNPDTGAQIIMQVFQLTIVLVFKKYIYLWGYSG